MTQTWETKLTPEQEAAQVARIVLFNDFSVDWHAKRAFDETFHSLAESVQMMLKDPPYSWYAGTRLFFEDVALELTYDGGNMQRTFFSNVLHPVWDTVIGCVILVNATADIDSRLFGIQLRIIRSTIQRMKVYYWDDFPVTVVALKKQGEDSFSAEELRILINSPRQFELNELPIVICDPTDRESVKGALLTALEAGLRYVDFDEDEVVKG